MEILCALSFAVLCAVVAGGAVMAYRAWKSRR